MKRKSLITLFAGLLVAAAFAAGPAPTGIAQTGICIDPNYCPEEPAAGTGTGTGSGTATDQELLKKCVKKAKKKFRNNAVKKKAAIKKCKKKYG